jgi:PAS domain S-box-containing protein
MPGMTRRAKADLVSEADALRLRMAQQEPSRPESLQPTDPAQLAVQPFLHAGADGLLIRLLDSLPALVSFVTSELRYAWINQHYESWFGLPRDRIIGESPQSILPPDAFERMLIFCRRALAGELVHYQNTLIRRDGSARHLDTTYVPHFDQNGSVIGFLVLAFDTTDHWEAQERLRESETRFRQLAENIGEVFWMSTGTGDKTLYVSPAFEKIWGRSADELYRRPSLWLEAIIPEDRDRVQQHYHSKRWLEGGFHNEYRIARPDGAVRWIHDRGFPVRDDKGKVYRIVGFAQDVTELQQAADRERQLLADLAHMARLTTMGEMASGLAHELNQPLSAIMNYLDASVRLLQNQGKAPDNVLSAMGSAAAEAERAGKIIHRMKNFLRRTEPRQSAEDVNQLVQEALDLIAREIRLSSTRLRMELAEGLPRVMADRIQIEQVILNLARNALDAMQQTEPEKRILTVKTARDAARAVTVSVSDTGVGLSADSAEQLFQAFYTTKPEGMGMGLAISRTIVQAHGGRLWAEPGNGRGATFTFTLPVATEDPRR